MRIITRLPRHHRKQDFLLAELEKESDRAAVILAGAMFDEALLALLRKRLGKCPSKEDQLLDGAYAPLGSFSSRIDAAYRLGIYHQQFWTALHLVRKIRNKFAHHIEGCTFADTAVASRVRELCIAVGMKDLIDVPRMTSRKRFEESASWMLFYLWSCFREVVRIKIPIIIYRYERHVWHKPPDEDVAESPG